MTFETDKYIIIKNGINKDMVEFLKIQTKMFEKSLCINNNINKEKYLFCDSDVKECFSYYAPLFSESLLILLHPIIEQITGKQLYPTYSYIRIYYNNAILNKHVDRESCEYSVTVCIKNDIKPWELWFKNTNNENISISLDEGDFIVYKGMELEHWREKYNGCEQMQFFLHYVDKNGLNSEWKYDKRHLIC